MKRFALTLLLALGVALAGCAKTTETPQAKSSTPSPPVSQTKAKPTAGPQERTTLKPVAPVEREQLAPTAEKKPAIPAASHVEKSAEPGKAGPAAASSAKEPMPAMEKKEPGPAAEKEATPAME